MLEQIEARIASLSKAIESSAANHNVLMGALAEAKYLYNIMVQEAPSVATGVADAVAIASDVEAAAPAVEAAVPAIAADVADVASVASDVTTVAEVAASA